MKKAVLVLLLATITQSLLAQKIVKNEVDEFTGHSVKETSWTTFTSKSKLYSYTRLRKVDNTCFLGFKMVTKGVVCSVKEGETLFFKLSNNEIMKVTNLDHEITSVGAGAASVSWSNVLGLHLKCSLNKDQIAKLNKHNIVKVRVNTSVGYIEAELKEKQSLKFKKALALL